MSSHEHMAMADKSLNIGIMTFSDTRNQATDKSGKILTQLFEEAGHKIVCYEVVKEDPEAMRARLMEWLEDESLEAIVTTGGTGIAARDCTIEVARSLFVKELDGFGEIFRLISFQQINAAAILTRATAGLAKGKILVCLPGSSKAVRLATERMLITQLPHMVWEARR